VHQRVVHAFGGSGHALRRRRRRCLWGSSLRCHRRDVTATDLVPAADELRRKLAGTHPSVRRLVVDAELVGSALEIDSLVGHLPIVPSNFIETKRC
jgi:hypothetical protein